jgi:hypothetical protein
MRLSDLADAKLIPESALRSFGLTEANGEVLIPYYDATGFVLAYKRRTAVQAVAGSYWPAGRKLRPYGLNEVAKLHKDWLVLVEGESDAWTCWLHGIPALGVPGATTAGCVEAEALAGVERLYLHQENDKGGAQFVAGLSRHLRQLAFAGEVRVFSSPAPHKDLNDWYRAELAAFAAECTRALAAAPLVSRSPQLDRLGFTALADVPAEPERGWLWTGRLPRGALSILDGDPGVGKSSITLDLAARFSSGRPMPFEAAPAAGSPGHVLILSAEDSAAAVVRPRLERCGADLSKILVHSPDRPDLLAFPDGWEQVEALAAERPLGLVIVDPLMAFFQGGVDSNKDADVRRTFRQATALADRTKAAVLFVRHLNKNGTQKALYRGGGSIGIIGAARCALLAAAHPRQPGRGAVAVSKSNYGDLALGAVYQPRLSGPLLDWIEETGFSADELAVARSPHLSSLSKAIAFLQALLADGEGHECRALLRQAQAEGLHPRTVYRAREELPIVSTRGADGLASWKWAETL